MRISDQQSVLNAKVGLLEEAEEGLMSVFSPSNLRGSKRRVSNVSFFSVELKGKGE